MKVAAVRRCCRPPCVRSAVGGSQGRCQVDAGDRESTHAAGIRPRESRRADQATISSGTSSATARLRPDSADCATTSCRSTGLVGASPPAYDVSCPTLLLYGDADTVISLDHARYYSSTLDEPEFVTFDNAGHVFAFTRRTESSAAIRTFFEAARPIELLAPGEHLHELLDPFRLRLVLLRGLDPVEDRVAVPAVELGERRCRPSCSSSVQPRAPVEVSAVLGASYATSQRPSAFARSISASPAGCIRPSSMSSSARATFRFDHMLRFARGTQRCTWSLGTLALPLTVDPSRSKARTSSVCW